MTRGLSDDDLSPEATIKRIELLHMLIADESLEAAQRVMDLINACPDEDESILHNRLHGELALLAAIRHRSAEQDLRMIEVVNEIVETFGDHPQPEIRAHALMAEAALSTTGGPAAAEWLERVREREDYDLLMNFDSLRVTVQTLERMVAEDRPGRIPEALPEHAAQAQRLRDLLRWWTEPGAPLPQRLSAASLPPPGAVDVMIFDEVDAQDVLALAAQLAADLRFGDSLICVRAVREYAQREGHDLTCGLAHVIEGQLLRHVDRVADAAERLWEGAGRLWTAGWHQASAQAFLDLARMGAQHPELDAVLADRVEVDRETGPARHLFRVAYAARSVSEATGDALGVWSAELARAQLLHATGDGWKALEAMARLGRPPAGEGREALIAQAALFSVQAELDTRGTGIARQALGAAERTIAAQRPWFGWQLDALRAAVELADGRLDAAWEATSSSLETLRQLRWVVGDERERSSWVASRQAVWSTALDIAAQRRPADALAVVEDAKSAHLARLILANATAGPDHDTAALVRHALSRLALRSERVTTLDADSLRRSFDAASDAIRELRKRDALVSAAVAPPSFDLGVLDELAREVGEFVLLSYADLGAHGVWVVTATGAGVTDVRRIALDARARRTLKRLEAAGGAAIENWIASGDAEDELAELGRRLLAPLEAAPTSAEQTLLIAPSGGLSNVPWGMLEDGDGVALIDRYAITLLPSLLLSHMLLDRGEETGSPLALLCDPGNDLPHADVQAQGIATIWSDVALRTGRHTSFDALRATSEQGGLESSRRLIWIGHGAPHPSEPRASGLLLGDETVLSAGMIGALRVPGAVDLWTCGSSAEARLSGDEQIGIVAAMMGAGARSVLAMLWALDDSWVAPLSERFYRAIADGAGPAAALRQAQRQSRRDVPGSVWGAAVLWGLPTPKG